MPPPRPRETFSGRGHASRPYQFGFANLQFACASLLYMGRELEDGLSLKSPQELIVLRVFRFVIFFLYRAWFSKLTIWVISLVECAVFFFQWPACGFIFASSRLPFFRKWGERSESVRIAELGFFLQPRIMNGGTSVLFIWRDCTMNFDSWINWLGRRLRNFLLDRGNWKKMFGVCDNFAILLAMMKLNTWLLDGIFVLSIGRSFVFFRQKPKNVQNCSLWSTKSTFY